MTRSRWRWLRPVLVSREKPPASGRDMRTVSMPMSAEVTRAERSGPVRGFDQRLDRGRHRLASAHDLLVVEGDLPEEGRDDRRGADGDHAMHVPDEGAERVGFLVGRLPDLCRGAPQGVQDDRVHERAPLGEPPVEGGDPDTCPPRDLIERGPGTVLD